MFTETLENIEANLAVYTKDLENHPGEVDLQKKINESQSKIDSLTINALS